MSEHDEIEQEMRRYKRGDAASLWLTLPRVVTILVAITAPLGGLAASLYHQNESLSQQAHDNALKEDVLREMKGVLADGLNTFAENQNKMIRKNLQEDVTFSDLSEWVRETMIIRIKPGHEQDFADPRDVRDSRKKDSSQP